MAQERIPHLDMQWASQTKILQLQFVTCILLEVENDIKIAGLVLLSDYFGSISRNSFPISEFNEMAIGNKDGTDMIC